MVKPDKEIAVIVAGHTTVFSRYNDGWYNPIKDQYISEENLNSLINDYRTFGATVIESAVKKNAIDLPVMPVPKPEPLIPRNAFRVKFIKVMDCNGRVIEGTEYTHKQVFNGSQTFKAWEVVSDDAGGWFTQATLERMILGGRGTGWTVQFFTREGVLIR